MSKIVEEWTERAKHDLEAGRVLLRYESYSDIVLFHAHQAIEKCLKGFLIHHGWKLKKIHDLETLLAEASDFDRTIGDYLDLGRRLTAFYYIERYPSGPVPLYSAEETRRLYNRGSALIQHILDQLENA